MRSTYQVTFLVPESLYKLSEVLTTHGYSNHAKYHIDKYFYLLDRLHLPHIVDKTLRPDSFVLLHRDILSSLLGPDYYYKIISNLIEWGIIECDNLFIKGEKSLGYRLTEKYRHDSYIRIWSYDTRFTNKLTAYKQNQLDKTIQSNGLNKKFVDSLESHVNSVTIEAKPAIEFCLEKLWESYYLSSILLPAIDLDQDHFATTILNSCKILLKDNPKYRKEETERKEREEYNSRFTKVKNRERYIKKKPETDDYDFDKFTADLKAIERIHVKEFSFTFDNKGGRLHTNFTNLSSSLRPFLRLDGQKLVGCDIANSQPLFFALLLIDYYKERGQDAYLIDDVKLYIQDCIAGKFYDNLMRLAGILPEDEEKRKAFKTEFFGSVFFNKPPKRLSQNAKLCKERFPTVFDKIQEIKGDDYTQLAIGLQRKESHMILWDVMRKIQRSNHSLKMISIHDAIYTTEGCKDIIEQQIKASFQKKYHITPKIK